MADSFWWCNRCASRVDPPQVTFWESHVGCGGTCEVRDDEPDVFAAARAWQALRDWLDAPRWQPIETAPKNGDEVLAWDGNIQATVYAQTVRGEVWWQLCEAGDATSATFDASHWMPLPAPPSEVIEQLRAELADEKQRTTYCARCGDHINQLKLESAGFNNVESKHEAG